MGPLPNPHATDSGRLLHPPLCSPNDADLPRNRAGIGPPQRQSPRRGCRPLAPPHDGLLRHHVLHDVHPHQVDPPLRCIRRHRRSACRPRSGRRSPHGRTIRPQPNPLHRRPTIPAGHRPVLHQRLVVRLQLRHPLVGQDHPIQGHRSFHRHAAHRTHGPACCGGTNPPKLLQRTPHRRRSKHCDTSPRNVKNSDAFDVATHPRHHHRTDRSRLRPRPGVLFAQPRQGIHFAIPRLLHRPG